MPILKRWGICEQPLHCQLEGLFKLYPVKGKMITRQKQQDLQGEMKGDHKKYPRDMQLI